MSRSPATCHPDRPVQAYGLCNACYLRAKRAGTLPPKPDPRPSAAVDWSRAACIGADPDLFAPHSRGVIPVEALRICRGCPIRDGCLDDALAGDRIDDDGVYGGTTVPQRIAIRRGRLTRNQAKAAGDRLSRRRTDAEIAADDNARIGARKVAGQRLAQAERRKAARILAEIATDHGLTVRDLTGPDRHRDIVAARHEAIRNIVARTDLSLSAVGRLVNRDHTTVIYAVRPKAVR